VGDKICVTGSIGDAAVGLALLRGDIQTSAPTDREYFLARLRAPNPRVGCDDAYRTRATAGIDISDGLLADLAHMCRASNVAAKIDQQEVPFSEPARRLIAADPTLPQRLMAGGDDYEVLFTISATDSPNSIFGLSCPITVIGEIIEGSGVNIEDSDGNISEAGAGGFRHF
jgi:thiamine-monophosphate kinase